MPAEVVMVVGACGGAGASTLAALLAGHRSRSGRRVSLVDLGGSGGGLEVLLGIEDEPGARWRDLDQIRGALDPDDLDGVLPHWQQVEVLSADRRGGPVDEAAVAPVWRALAAGRDTVVVDTPAHGLARPWVDEMLEQRTDLLMITGQDVIGVAAALGATAACGHGAAQLVLRGRRRPRVAPLEAAKVLDLPLLAVVPTDRSVGESTDRGLGPVVTRWSGLGRAVDRVARGVGRG